MAVPVRSGARPSAPAALIVLATAALCGWLPIRGEAGEAPGAEIVEVVPTRPAAQAGMRVGDVVSAYRAEAGPLDGTVDGAADLANLETQWGDLGAVILVGRSGPTEREWRLPGNGWGLKARPVATGTERALLDQALAALEQGDVDGGCAALAGLRDAWAPAGRVSDVLWVQSRCLEERIRKQQAEHIPLLVDQIWPPGQGAADTRHALGALRLAATAQEVAQWELLQQLTGIAEAGMAQDALLATVVALRRGKALIVQGQFADALAMLEPASANVRTTSPGSLRLAAFDNEIAWANLNLGHYPEAERLLREALVISTDRALNDMDHAKYQGHLGMVLHARGDFDGAEEEVEAALARLERGHAPDRLLAPVLNNLGVIRFDRGDFAGAEEAFRRTAEMERLRSPESILVAVAYGNLAAIARARGNLDGARDWTERARQILEKAVPDGTEMGQNLHMQGVIALGAGHLDEAERHFRAAGAIWARVAPDSPRQAASLEFLGLIALRRQLPDEARRLFADTLALRLSAAPDGLEAASSWYQIGNLELAEQRFPEARAALVKAVRINERLAPESLPHAKSLNALGRLEQAQGEAANARATLCRASAVLDAVRPRLSRDALEQAETIAQHARIRQDCVAAQVDAGNPTGAFETLERGRGRALLTVLAQRDLTFGAELPSELRRELALVEVELQSARRAASTAAPVPSQKDALVGLEAKRAALIERVRREAPRTAELRFPEPIGFTQVAQALDNATALVAFTVGEDKSYAFLARRGSDVPVVRALPIRRQELGAALAALRAAFSPGAGDAASAQRQARTWHDRLIEPVLADLSGISHVVVVPDSELFAVPFAALTDADGTRVVDRFAVSIAHSATLWSRGRDPAHLPGLASPLVAVANGSPVTDFRGHDLPALPFVRSEVEGIAATARGDTRVLEGNEATESLVNQLARRAGSLHFAAHGVLDPGSPLESGLVLAADPAAAGSAADGFLQAWEIFDGWRIPAALITLSGCETALGSSLADEGLVGLTRAFQFAGARHVVASLWAVPDRSTAELMTRFYQQMGAGLSVPDALRAAQRSHIGRNSSGDAQPARGVGGIRARARDPGPDQWAWAAFQVYGS